MLPPEARGEGVPTALALSVGGSRVEWLGRRPSHLCLRLCGAFSSLRLSHKVTSSDGGATGSSRVASTQNS